MTRHIGSLCLAAFIFQCSTEGAAIDSLADLPYDENGKLSTHMLIYSEKCESSGMDFDVPKQQFQIQTVTGEAEVAFFGDAAGQNENTKESCPAVCIERGVDRTLVDKPMPERRYDPSDGKYNRPRDWFWPNCVAAEFCVVNYHNEKTPLKLYWIDFSNNRSDRGELHFGEKKTRCIESFINHRFQLVDAESDELVLDHTVEFHTIITAGESPPYTGIQPDYTSRIYSTHNNEWKRHNRVSRSFSALGFRKGRLPDDIYGSIGAFYYNNHQHRFREEWRSKGVFVNWWETDVFFIPSPWKLKGLWQDRLRELVEAWVGVELEQTDMYGLRQYTEGARLLTHVDREATHAASLIVNIAQGNLSEPWPVEVYDHADRLHEVVMEPGDIVYYESAKCLHGRNKPLKGEGAFYTNLFTHYRPTGDSEWFKRDNPEGTPKPLIDVGDCRLEGTIDQVGQGAVKCDNPAIGPYLSPTQFVARSGDDLSEWWRRTSPEPLEESDPAAEEL